MAVTTRFLASSALACSLASAVVFRGIGATTESSGYYYITVGTDYYHSVTSVPG